MRKSRIISVSAAVLAVLAGGCGARPRAPLRIGLNPWPGYEFVFLAQEKGFFEQQGVPVELVEYSSLGDVRRAFDRGQVDGMLCTLVEVLQARENTPRRPQVCLITDFSNGSDVILARRPTARIRELQGKRVAAEAGSLGMFVLARALERSGMSLKDVAVIPMDQSAMEKAFTSGEVDAAVTYPPVSVNLLKNERAVQIFNSSEIPGEVIDLLAIHAPLLVERRADAVKILRVWDRVLAYAKAHPEESDQMMAQRERLSVNDFRDALKGVRLLSARDQQELLQSGKLDEAVRATSRLLHAVGALKGPDHTDGVFAVEVYRAALMP